MSERNSIIDVIAKDLNVPVPVVLEGLKRPFKNYKKICIKKRSGGVRVAYHPAVELKMIQAWLVSEVFSIFPISDIAMAYIKNKSILDNARKHRGSDYFVRIDIKDFFESIRFSDLEGVVRSSKGIFPDFVLDKNFLNDIVLHSCFVDSGKKMPVGYLTSPSISNIVMKKFDDSLVYAVASDPLLKSGVITRYADDFVFSSVKKGACRHFVNIFNKALSECCSPKLVVNKEKTMFMSRKGGRAIVTGLLINGNGNIVLTRSLRDRIRLLLSLREKGSLCEDDKLALAGYLSFVKHVDPSFFTKISFRHHAIMKNI